MSKPVSAIICLVSFSVLFIPNSAQAADSLQESIKEKTTSESQTSGETEHLPAEALMTPTTSPILDRAGNSVLETKQNWIGYLISANSVKEFKSQSDRSNFLSKYDRQTALSPISREKGYLLYTNNKWYTLDKHGNDLAAKTIQGSLKSQGFYVSVSGKLESNTIIVDKLAEITD